MKYHYFVAIEYKTPDGQLHKYRTEIATKNKILYFKQIEELEKRLKDRVYKSIKTKVDTLIIVNYILLRKEPEILKIVDQNSRNLS